MVGSEGGSAAPDDRAVAVDGIRDSSLIRVPIWPALACAWDGSVTTRETSTSRLLSQPRSNTAEAGRARKTCASFIGYLRQLKRDGWAASHMRAAISNADVRRVYE